MLSCDLSWSADTVNSRGLMFMYDFGNFFNPGFISSANAKIKSRIVTIFL